MNKKKLLKRLKRSEGYTKWGEDCIARIKAHLKKEEEYRKQLKAELKEIEKDETKRCKNCNKNC